MAKHETLTPKQARFVEVYLSNGRRGADAYRRSYDADAPPQRAAEQACKLLRHPKLAPLIEEAEKRNRAATERAVTELAVTGQRVIAETAAAAFVNVAAAVEVTSPKDIARLPEAVQRAIAGWSWDRRGNFIIRWHSKLQALQMLGQHFGVWNGNAAERDEKDELTLAALIERSYHPDVRALPYLPSNAPTTFPG